MKTLTGRGPESSKDHKKRSCFCSCQLASLWCRVERAGCRVILVSDGKKWLLNIGVMVPGIWGVKREAASHAISEQPWFPGEIKESNGFINRVMDYVWTGSQFSGKKSCLLRWRTHPNLGMGDSVDLLICLFLRLFLSLLSDLLSPFTDLVVPLSLHVLLSLLVVYWSMHWQWIQKLLNTSDTSSWDI